MRRVLEWSMAVKPASIRELEAQFVCTCGDEEELRLPAQRPEERREARRADRRRDEPRGRRARPIRERR